MIINTVYPFLSFFPDNKHLATEYIAKKRSGVLPMQYFPKCHDILLNEMQFTVVKMENMLDVKSAAIQNLLRDVGVFNLDNLDQQQEVIDITAVHEVSNDAANASGKTSQILFEFELKLHFVLQLIVYRAKSHLIPM